jgi:hypothetical protein
MRHSRWEKAYLARAIKQKNRSHQASGRTHGPMEAVGSAVESDGLFPHALEEMPDTGHDAKLVSAGADRAAEAAILAEIWPGRPHWDQPHASKYFFS